jgi:GTPase SAR1 family protein
MQLLQKIFSPKPVVSYYAAKEKINLGKQNIIISGTTGTGKTTLCKKLVQEALESDRKVYVISNDSSYSGLFTSEKYVVDFRDYFELWSKDIALFMLDFYRSIPSNSLIVVDECTTTAICQLTMNLNEYECASQVIAVTQDFPSINEINPKWKKEILNFYKTFLFSSVSNSNAIVNLPGCSEVSQPNNSYDWLEVRYS